jgi:lipoprotein-anchoring transpeptidase ErfK/SrfK
LRRFIVILPLLAAGLVLSSEFVLAQSGWTDRGPVFESDVKRKAAQQEAERAARRKSYGPVVYPKFMQGGKRPDIKPVAPPIVFLDQNEEVGSIIIDTRGRKLYFVLPGKKAYQYSISVGRDGFTWIGTERISRIVAWPSWTPPPEMHKRVPGLPVTVTGGLLNPQGARALYLGNSVYRIHGTNNERTVGRANSSGCFRLANEHVVHLASIAKVGTKVKVLKGYAGGVSENAPLSSLFSFGSSEEAAAPHANAKRKRPPAKKPAKLSAKKAATAE